MNKEKQKKCEKCQEQYCKAHHMKEVGRNVDAVIADVVERGRIWIGSGEDFHPAVIN